MKNLCRFGAQHESSEVQLRHLSLVAEDTWTDASQLSSQDGPLAKRTLI